MKVQIISNNNTTAATLLAVVEGKLQQAPTFAGEVYLVCERSEIAPYWELFTYEYDYHNDSCVALWGENFIYLNVDPSDFDNLPENVRKDMFESALQYNDFFKEEMDIEGDCFGGKVVIKWLGLVKEYEYETEYLGEKHYQFSWVKETPINGDEIKEKFEIECNEYEYDVEWEPNE